MKLEINLERKMIIQAQFLCKNCGGIITISYDNQKVNPIIGELIANKIIETPKEFKFLEPTKCPCRTPKFKLQRKVIDWAYPEFH